LTVADFPFAKVLSYLAALVYVECHITFEMNQLKCRLILLDVDIVGDELGGKCEFHKFVMFLAESLELFLIRILYNLIELRIIENII